LIGDYEMGYKKEYIDKEELIKYLTILDWDMSRATLIRKVSEMSALKLTEEDINRINNRELVEEYEE
jgi:arginine repressor